MDEELTRASPAPIPSVIDDRYELREQIGRGGFATVHRAHDRKLDRSVAIKLLSLHQRVSKERIEVVRLRFQREARVAASLRHPSIIGILDVGELGPDRPYVVMEELHGHDMAEHMDRHGAMAPGRLIPLFCSCLMALHRAHDAGIVHKDLKPSNLFLCEPGAPEEHIKVLDFGIAFANEPDNDRLTQTGELLGTPRYMAPEYLERLEVSAALDVYQMGLVLGELLLGERLFQEQNMAQSMLMHLKGDLELPEPLTTGPWAECFAYALAYEPTQRYPSAQAFAQALERVDWSTWVRPTQPSTPTRPALTPTAAVSPDVALGAPPVRRAQEPEVVPLPVAVGVLLASVVILGVVAVGIWTWFIG